MKPKKDFRPMTLAEQAIVGKLLEKDFRGSREITQQLEGAQVRQINDLGSLSFLVISKVRVPLDRGVAVEASYSDSDTENPNDPQVNVLLHISDGKLSMLEIYKDDGSIIRKLPEPAKFQVFSPYSQ